MTHTEWSIGREEKYTSYAQDPTFNGTLPWCFENIMIRSRSFFYRDRHQQFFTGIIYRFFDISFIT